MNHILLQYQYHLLQLKALLKSHYMMGRPLVFERGRGGGGGLKYFDPELVDSFVENKNSDIKVICSDLYIFVTM